MVSFRKITEENFDAIINMKRPEGETLVAPNAVSLAQAWPYWNKKSAWKAANFPGAFLRNIHSFRQQTGKLQFVGSARGQWRTGLVCCPGLLGSAR